MKQLLFLLLFPCLALAQYTGNGNQKITLGEQTSADGLVFRGLAADTTRKPSVDTMAYILLDTNTNIIWQYKKATSNAWLRLNLLPSDTSSMLTNYYRSGRALGTPLSGTLTNATGLPLTSGVTGTLLVANGGTGQSTLTANKLMVGNGTSGVLTPTNLHWDNANSLLGVNTSTMIATLNVAGTGEGSMVLRDLDGTNTYMSMSHNNGESVWNSRNGTSNGTLAFYSQGTSQFLRLYIDANGNVGIGTISPAEKLHVVGNARITAVGSGAYGNILNITSDGTLTTAASSDINFKYNINPITYGLETILKLKPVSYQWINGDEYDLGFIAQDAVNVIPEAVDTFHDSSLLFRYNTIIPILTKAIQEQNVLIKALEQRLLILENK